MAGHEGIAAGSWDEDPVIDATRAQAETHPCPAEEMLAVSLATLEDPKNSALFPGQEYIDAQTLRVKRGVATLENARKLRAERGRPCMGSEGENCPLATLAWSALETVSMQPTVLQPVEEPPKANNSDIPDGSHSTGQYL